MPRLIASLRLATLLLVLSSSLVFANGGGIVTIAGTGQGGSLATGIPATTAQLVSPAGICADTSNNMFIADSGNNRVVRIDAATGLLTLVAGNGTASSSGDGGPAVAASLSRPMGVALDSAGNLFISEFQGNRIRRVDGQTGVITTIAGTGSPGFGGDNGAAASAVLNLPAGIAFDSTGNLYFADMGNNRVRRIDAQTGIVTTVAGTGSAISSADGGLATYTGIARPIWVAVDPSGGLLISEMGANLIRRVDPSSGIISTVAGNGNPNFTGDGVPATAAGIGAALALTVAPNGDLFFADGTGRIRRIDAATGWITTVAGNGTGPHGNSSASAGGGGGGSSTPTCYSTVQGDNGPATSATLDSPFGLLLTSSGRLLISDSLDCRVRRVDLPSPFSYTNTTLTASTTNPQSGQVELLTAAVSPIGLSGIPTGAIQFVATSPMGTVTVLATVALNGGTASYLDTTGKLRGSDYLVMAVYSGDPSFNGSGSPQILLSQSFGSKYLATITLSANQTPSPLGATTVFTATVTPPAGAGAPPSGPVVLVDGPGVVVATANLVNGIATLPVLFTTPGNHAMTPVYLGDNDYSQVAGLVLTQPVNGGGTQVSITSSAPNSTYGQPLQITISVLPSSATGTIQLTVDQVAIPGSGTLINGAVVAQPNPPLTAGSHTITAQYSGDGNNPPATSPTFIQNVAKATPSFTVTSSQNPSVAGQSVILAVTMTPVSSGAALGLDIGNPPASLQATWSAGRTSITTADLSPGTHTVTGTWAGDANVLPGSSTVLVQTVQAIATTTSLTATPNPSIYGGAVTLTATVIPAGTAGQAIFFDNGIAVGAASLAGGQAQLSIATLSAGSHSLTATYAGDATHASSNSAAVPQIVTPAITPSSVALTYSANPSVAGRPLWLTGTVSPATATGTVQFLDGGSPLGTANLAGGWATLSLSTLPVGTHSITAVYSGDVNDSASTSATLAVTIAPASPPAVVPSVITTLAGLPNGCAPGVTDCGMAHPASDTAGNIYYQQGYQIIMRNAAGSVTTIAGNGQPGHSGDGGPALSASLSSAGQLAAYGSRVCFGDPGAHKVRCVDLTTGLIQGYGTGAQGSSGNGGNVANATFNFPSGAAFDDLGNLYISDFSANNVRRIDAVTNNVTLLAGPGPGYSGAPLGDGGPAAGANLLQPQGLSFYNNGVYIADAGNGRIRRVDLATGMISSVVASSSDSIAFDQAGNLFFRSGLTVNIMDPSGNVTPIANANNYSGIGSDDILATDTVFGGMAGLGWDPLFKRLMITDQSRLRQIFFTPPTTTGLTLSPNPVAPGGQVALQATVSPAPLTGSVRFYQDATLLGSAPLVNNVATLTWTSPAGGHSTPRIRAVYGGDINNNLSISPTLTETVQPVVVTLTSSVNPVSAGQSLTFTASISPATATGTVQFLDGATPLGTAAISGGSASLSLSTLSVDTHSITAVYSGDANIPGATSSVLIQTISKAATSIVLTASPNPAMEGQPVTLTAVVTPATATGLVQIFEGTGILGTLTLSGGSASLTLSPQDYAFPVGTHSITVNYNGDANNAMSTSAVLTLTIVKRTATSMTLTSSPNPSAVGQPVTFTARLSPAAATGSVLFVDGTTVISTSPIIAGTATFTTSALTADTHGVTAVYNGDVNYAASSSLTITQTVKFPTATSLSSDNATVVSGQTVQFTAGVSPAVATGTVQFRDGSSALGTVTLSNGSAVLSISTLAVGVHSITAIYSGDAHNSDSTSPVLTETVNAPPPGPPSALSATAASSSQINLTWTASPTSGATYNIYASPTAGFTPSAANRIATGATTTSYSHTGLSANTAYYYRITARNANGESAASNQATATTKAALSCQVVYTVTTQWNVGFGTAITIKNTGTTPINGWKLTWTWAGNQKITQSWNSTYTQTGASAALTNESWNPAIAAGAKLSGMGFNGSYSGTNSAPTAFYLNGTLCH